MAGRYILYDHEAQASYRIMPIVCCIGEAAGTAIGLAVKDNKRVRKINVTVLRNTLVKNNGFIG